MKTLIALAVSAVAALGCGPAYVGNGHLVEQQRSVAAFDRVEIHNGYTASILDGPQSVSVRTDDNLQQFVETWVSDGVLVVHTRPGVVIAPTRVEIAVSNDVLTGLLATGGSVVTATATPSDDFPLEASGGSQIDISGISTALLDLDASGGSRITPTGVATAMNVAASGGSQVFGRDLPTANTNIAVSGGSRLDVRVSDSLRGSLSGGSTLRVYGHPTSAIVDSSGGSTVTFVGDGG